jgi:CelD/BcsL family acetyltransferase involved in cellulose biosynthesis
MIAASGIDIQVLKPPLDLGADWDDLVARAAPNVFMHPAGLNAAHETAFARIHVLIARERGGAGENARLLGVWALEELRLRPTGLRYLSAIPHRYAFLGGPVVDREQAGAVVAAMLRAIAEDRTLPRGLLARNVDGDAGVAAAVADGTVRRRIVFNERARAFLTPDAGAKRSGSTRKKLRQDWNRLAATGEAAIVRDQEPAAVRAAFEVFLSMEAAGWKGTAGTALLSDPADAHFTRRMVARYADQGAACVALLTVDGKAIAAQVVLRAGTHAYTWKIAYDEAFQKYSPGALLVDRLSEMLVADGCTTIDSCSPEGGFMNTLWSGRQPQFDVIAEVGTRPTLIFPLLVARTMARAYLKRRWQAMREKLGKAARAPRPLPAPTPTD